MKKIMIVATAALLAGFANAGAVKWSSGAIQTPGVDGVLSGSRLTSSSGYTLTMYAFESLSSFSFNEGDLFNWYSTNTDKTTQFNGLTAIEGTVNMGASATTATASGAELTTTANTSVYGAVLFVLSDAETGDALWYMENSGSIASKSGSTVATLANLALKQGGGSGTTATSWTSAAAIPEPTSGLLLLLGVAGLALRRRRA